MFEEGGLVDVILPTAPAAADFVAALPGDGGARLGVLEETLSRVPALVEAARDLPVGETAHEVADFLEDGVVVAFPVDEFELAAPEPGLAPWPEQPLPDGEGAAEPGHADVAA